MEIACPYAPDAIAPGDSIACNGVCLTVTECMPDQEGSRFSVDVSGETLSCTTLADWQVGMPVNLEMALRMGDLLGGHLVSGHVDGLATLFSIEKVGESHILWLEAPESLQYTIAQKGSVALDGVSLTVNRVDGNRFSVNIIPHTWTHTTLGERKTGDRLNLEIDLIARYVARLHERPEH